MIEVLRNYSTAASMRPSPYRYPGEQAQSNRADDGIKLVKCVTWSSSEPNWCLEADPIVGEITHSPAIWGLSPRAEGTLIKELCVGLKCRDTDLSKSTAYGIYYSDQVFAKTPAPRPALSGWVAILDNIIVELGRLTPGWDGEDSVLPSPRLLRDIETALRVLSAKTSEPNIDVDSSDGSVGLTWDTEDGRHIAASFSGNGRIFLFVGCPQAGNWSTSAAADDDVRILEMFDRAFTKDCRPA